jgi:hypothetical protein
LYRDTLFPKGLILETLATLALLFPSDEDDDMHWDYMPKQERVMNCGNLTKEQRHLKNFPYWGHRLVLLKEIEDKTLPPSQTVWKQLKNTGVNRPDQWFNSWTAIIAIGLTLFFGLIQSIEGAIQVYKAYNPDPR